MSYPFDSQEIRGAAFLNTVTRELYFQKKANDILEKHGLLGGNEPLGTWRYGQELGDKLKNDLPQIDKYCGLFKTLGDKRLSTHLL